MIIVLIIVSALVSALSPAFGDELSNTANPTNPNVAIKGDITLGTGVIMEGDGDDAKVLIKAEWRGVRQGTGDPHVTYRYFWVKASVGVAVSTDEAELNSINVSVVPVTRVEQLRDTVTQIRYAPFEIRRSVDLGMDSSVMVQVVGFSKSIEKPLFGPDGAANLARFTKFAQVAVDLIGLRVINFANQASPFAGAQIGVVSAVGGLSWNINESVSLRVAIGGKESLALGNGAQVVNETDLYGKLELLFKTAYAKYSLYLAGGYYTFHGPVDHDEPYIMIGFSSTF